MTRLLMTNFNPSYSSLGIYKQLRDIELVYKVNKNLPPFSVTARIWIMPQTLTDRFSGMVHQVRHCYGERNLQGVTQHLVNYRSRLSNVKSDTHQTSLTFLYCSISPVFVGHLNVIKQIPGKSHNLHTVKGSGDRQCRINIQGDIQKISLILPIVELPSSLAQHSKNATGETSQGKTERLMVTQTLTSDHSLSAKFIKNHSGLQQFNCTTYISI